MMKINEEIWRDIYGYEGKYQISSHGRVKSIERTHTTHNKWGIMERVVKDKILKTQITNNGYVRVVLCKDGKTKTMLVHRLVAQAFLPNPDKLPCVNHKDETPNNNCIENLEWCTHEYNSNYGTSKERISDKHKGKTLTTEHKSKIADSKKLSIIQYDKDMNIIAVWDSGKEAESITGIDAGNISEVCKGKRKTAGGFVWKYNEIKKYVC